MWILNWPVLFLTYLWKLSKQKMKNPNCRKSAQQHNFLHFSINIDTSQTHFKAFKSLTPMLLLFTDLIGTIITDLQSYLPLTFPQVFPIKNKTTSKTVTNCLTKHFIIKVIWRKKPSINIYFSQIRAFPQFVSIKDETSSKTLTIRSKKHFTIGVVGGKEPSINIYFAQILSIILLLFVSLRSQMTQTTVTLHVITTGYVNCE